MVVKLHQQLIKVPFPDFAQPNVLLQPERIWSLKGSKSKRAEKNERKRARKEFGRKPAIAKKDRSKFWLMCRYKIKIFYIYFCT